MMQSPEAQYQLALKMPMNRLMSILQGQPDAVVGQPIAMMAMQALKEQKTAAQGMQAQQQLQQPNVKDQLLAEDQGIAKYPAPNMNAVANAAHGGVVGYDSGGAVQHFFGGAPVRSTSGGQSWFLDLPETIRDPSVPFYSEVPNPVYQRLGNSQFPTKKAAEDAYNAVSGARGDVLPGVSDFDKAYPAIPRGQAETERSNVGRPGNDELGRPLRPTVSAPVAPVELDEVGNPMPAPVVSAPVKLDEVGNPMPAPQYGQQRPGPQVTPRPQVTSRPQVQSAPSPYTGAIPTAQDMGTGVGLTGPQQQVGPSTTPSPDKDFTTGLNTYEDALTKSRVAGTDYEKKINDIVAKFGDTKEQKNQKNAITLGSGLLSIASDLLTPGQTGAGARANAFKTIAGIATKYKDEDKADRDALTKADLMATMGIAQLRQKDADTASRLYGNAQDILVKQADLAGRREIAKMQNDVEFKKLSLAEQELKIKEAYNKGILSFHSASLGVQEKIAGMNADVQYRGQNIRADTQRMGFVKYDNQVRTEASKQLTNSLIAQSKLTGPKAKEAIRILNDSAAFNQMLQDRINGGIGAPRSQFQVDAIPEDAEMQ